MPAAYKESRERTPWARAKSIYDLIQKSGHKRAVFKRSGKLYSTPQGTALYEKVLKRPTLIGVYDTSASLSWIEADLETNAK